MDKNIKCEICGQKANNLFYKICGQKACSSDCMLELAKKQNEIEDKIFSYNISEVD